jgi:hypothetical protein
VRLPGSEKASPPRKRDRTPDDQTPVDSCAKSVPRRANTARQSVDRVDTNQPLNWAFQNAMAPC